jgi:WD40 repeat protein
VKLSLVLLALGACTVATVGANPTPAEPGTRSPSADALPAGAKLRLGTLRLAFPSSTNVALLAPDYRALIAVGADGAVRRYEVGTGRLLDERQGGSPAFRSFAVSPNGKRVVVPGETFLIRDVETGRSVAEIQETVKLHRWPSDSPEYAFSPDGKILARGGAEVLADQRDLRRRWPPQTGDGMVLVWNVETNKLLVQVRTGEIAHPCPTLSPDGKTLATWGSHRARVVVLPTRSVGLFETPKLEKVTAEPQLGRTVQVWSTETGKELFRMRLTGSGHDVVAAAFSPDGQVLAASGGDGSIDLWDARTGKPIRTLLGRAGQGHRLAFSPDGKTLATVALSGTVERWVVADGRVIGSSQPPTFPVPGSAMELVFADNTRVIVRGVVGRFAVVWEASTGKLLTPQHEYVSDVYSLGFGAGGKEVVVSYLDGRVLRWDAATGKNIGAMALRTAEEHVPFKPTLTVSSDGTRGLRHRSSTAPNQTVAIHDLATGDELFAIPAEEPSPDLKWVIATTSPRFQPSDQVLTGCTVSVWDVANQRKVRTIEFPRALMVRARVSPSGARLVTVCEEPRLDKDRVVGVTVVTGWDLKSGKKLAEVEPNGPNPWPRRVHAAATASESAVVIASLNKLWVVDYERGVTGEDLDTRPVGANGEFGPIVFSADGKCFAAGMPTGPRDEYAIRVYDWPRGRTLHTFTGHRGQVTALAFAPDGKTLASGSSDGTVLLWDLTEKSK